MDLSLKTRSGPPSFDIHDPEIQKLLKKDLLFNIYRDGVFGNFKHIPILEGKQTFGYFHHANNVRSINNDIERLVWLVATC